MSKAARIIAAVVVTVAAVVTGDPNLIRAAIAMDTALIVDAVTPKPKITSTGQESRWKADPRAGIPYAVGRCAVAGYQVFQRSAPANTGKFKNYVTVYTGAGPIDGFESFLVNDVPVSFTADSGEGASGYYLNRMWLKRQVGAASSPYMRWTATGSKDTPANHGGRPSEWTSAHELPGFAASLWGLEWDQTRYSGGTPSPRMVARWVKVYDPRKDSTYPGGSGSHRYADPSDKAAYLAAQATWEWSANPYLHGLMWCLGRWFGDPARLDLPLVKTHGLGAPMSKIEVSNFVECANIAQANAWTLAGEVSSVDDKWEVLKEFLEAGGGEPILLGHKIGCMINAPKVSLATITKSDAVGDVSVAASTSIEDRINTIWPSYTEESLNWTLVPFDTPVRVSAYLTPDKGERSIPMSLPMVQNPVQMAQLARYRIEDSRELTPIVIPAKPWTMWLRPGDCFTANEPEWGLNNQKLLILQRKRDPATMIVTFVCRTETDGKHAFALGQTATPPDTPALTGLDARIVPPPADDAWIIVSGSVVGPDGTLPGITIIGESDNPNAVSVVVEYREVIAGSPVTFGEWIAKSFPASSKVLVVSGLKPGATYQVRVRYITAAGVENPGTNLDLGSVPVAPVDAGTVGGFDLDAIIDAAADGVTGDIAAAQADATAALTQIAAEVARATGAEGTLTTNLASLTSTVGTNTSAISAEALTRSTADTALSALVTSLTSTVGANKASADSSIATLTTADVAIAARTAVLEAEGGGVNRQGNARFASGFDHWPIHSTQWATGDTASGEGTWALFSAGGSAGVTAILYGEMIPWSAGQKIGLAGRRYVNGITSGVLQAYVGCYDAAGNPTGTRQATQFYNAGFPAGQAVGTQNWAGALGETTPAGTTQVRVQLEAVDVSSAAVLGVFRVMLSDDPRRAFADDATTASTVARLVTEGLTRSAADSALSSLITALTSTVGTNTANISANLITQTSGDAALAASITSLTTTVGANKASADASIATLTTADTALASSVSSLTATTSGLSATVTTQAVTIADSASKLAAARLIFETAAGGGRPARFGLYSDSYGGSAIALNAAQIYFGDNTVFDDATDTLRTTIAGSAWVQAWGASFGVSSNLREWQGADIVALSAMSVSNAYFYRTQAGQVGGSGFPSSGSARVNGADFSGLIGHAVTENTGATFSMTVPSGPGKFVTTVSGVASKDGLTSLSAPGTWAVEANGVLIASGSCTASVGMTDGSPFNASQVAATTATGAITLEILFTGGGGGSADTGTVGGNFNVQYIKD